MRIYKFYWLDGSTNISKGSTPTDAFTKLGFGNGALPALDYWEDITKTLEGE